MTVNETSDANNHQPHIAGPTLVEKFFAEREAKQEVLATSNPDEFRRYQELVAQGMNDYLRDECSGKSWKQLSRDEQVRAALVVVKNQLGNAVGDGYHTCDEKDCQVAVSWSTKHDWIMGGVTVVCLVKIFEHNRDESKTFIDIHYDVYIDADGHLKQYNKKWYEMECEPFSFLHPTTL